MTTEMIYYFLTNQTAMCIIAFVTLILTVWVIDTLFRSRHSEKLTRLAPYINSIPFLAGLILLVGVYPIIGELSRALSDHPGSSVNKTATPQFQEVFIVLTVCCGLFFIFLAAWFIVRMLYKRFLGELEPRPKE